MELSPRTTRINIKMVVWLAIVVFVLCLVCVLLRVKLDALLNVYVTKQVSQQAELIADLANEKLHMRLNALSMIARKIEADGSHVEDFMALSDLKNGKSSYGLVALDGTVYTEKSVFALPDESYRCIMESFRGKQSICYSEKMGILLGVPVFHGHNVRFVLYLQYDEIPINDFFDVDCFDKKCFAQVIDNFKSGLTAMTIHHIGSSAQMMELFGDDVGAFVFPKGEGQWTSMGDTETVMFESCQNKEAAFEWMAYLATGKGQETWCTVTGNVPVAARVQALDQFQSNPFMKVSIEGAPVAGILPVRDTTTEWIGNWPSMIQQALLGQMTAEDCMKTLQETLWAE